ncbi:MAG: hypothetical protein MUC61_00320 [Amoebophilaceae bacterium]|jgi:hypothetical protein|nr:hypothetical protein [Amoebophilaceae bacterium]
MYIPFHQLSGEAHVWVYQASRPFGQEEKAAVLQKAQEFLGQWASHGLPLQCSAEILYDQFLILAVDETLQSATGCAVDASVKFIRTLEQAFQVDLLSRTHVAFRQGEDNFLVPLSQLEDSIRQGAISEDMLTFDNTITKKTEIVDKWLVRAGESWFGRYFRK